MPFFIFSIEVIEGYIPILLCALHKLILSALLFTYPEQGLFSFEELTGEFFGSKEVISLIC